MTDTGNKDARLPYMAPKLVHLDNVKEITRECANWQCSVVVPPAPTP